MGVSKGKIIIRAGVNVWPHELRTAEALADAGYEVEFIPKDNREFCHSADALINGTLYEMKSPESSRLSVVEKNINKALSQSSCLVFDSKRMKNAKDYQIEHELMKSIAAHRKIKALIFVDKKRGIHRLK